MLKMAFVSRHVPTERQVQLAAEAGWQLDFVGDADAFNDLTLMMKDLIGGGYNGVACVHPLIALEACAHGMSVGVFRAEKRGASEFEAVELRIWENKP